MAAKVVRINEGFAKLSPERQLDLEWLGRLTCARQLDLELGLWKPPAREPIPFPKRKRA